MRRILARGVWHELCVLSRFGCKQFWQFGFVHCVAEWRMPELVLVGDCQHIAVRFISARPEQQQEHSTRRRGGAENAETRGGEQSPEPVGCALVQRCERWRLRKSTDRARPEQQQEHSTRRRTERGDSRRRAKTRIVGCALAHRCGRRRLSRSTASTNAYGGPGDSESRATGSPGRKAVGLPSAQSACPAPQKGDKG